jgi:pimeloyl-ACP methyl ester carboxylesterase
MPTSAPADRIATTGGARVSYTSVGHGPAVLLIQGVGVAGTGWTPQTEALAGRYRAITFDNRGIGASTLGTEPLRIEAMAADALAIADAEGIDRFHVVGHSLGGLISQHVALTAGSRVKSLALLCTFANGRDGSKMSPGMMLRGIALRVGTRAMRRNAMLRLVMPASYLQTVDRVQLATTLGSLFGRDLADQPPIIMQQLRAMSRYSALSRLPQLSRLPTLVMSATHDLIAPPPLGRGIAAAIAGARFVEFPDAGHALPIQCAAETNALLLEHIDAAERAASDQSAT